MFIVKAAASLLVLFVARTLSAEYKRYAEEKNAVREGFLSLLEFIKNELGCRLRSVAEWAAEFENDALERSGFIAELLKTGSLAAAFSASKSKMPPLGAEAKRVLETYFSSFGRSYKEDEEEKTARAKTELANVLKNEREAAEKSVRAMTVLCYAVALGVIILFI